jgi:hypothetical protein
LTIPVVADADALFQATTRGLLIFLDYQGLIKLHWSPLILDEVSRALVDSGRKNTLDDAKAHGARMCDALPNAQVSVADVHSAFEAVASAVRSAKDIHVAACAHYLIAARAYPNALPIALVTRNIKDFKKDALAEPGHCVDEAGRLPGRIDFGTVDGRRTSVSLIPTGFEFAA